MNTQTTSAENSHVLSIQEALVQAGSQAGGLSEREANERLERNGGNELPQKGDRTVLDLALAQFTDPLILILIVAGALSLVLGERVDAVIIFAAVAVNAVIGFTQEYKVSEIIARLKGTLRQAAVVVREDQVHTVESREIVVGDIIVLQQGDRISADARIISETGLRTNEASLTGESMPVHKETKPVPADMPVSDRVNMVYSGTFVEEGTARAVVTATGIGTELGRIASLVLRERGRDRTPLQLRFRSLAKILAIVFVVISIALFGLGVARGEEPLTMFLTAVAIAVAAVPESLPVAVSVVLAIGARRILEKGGLVRKMSAAETLGGVTVIATDKTATLTEGRMRVVNFVMGDGTDIPKERFVARDGDKAALFQHLALTTNAFVEDPSASPAERVLSGNPIDRAILLMTLDAGVDMRELKREFPRIDEIPFQASYKYSAVLNEAPDGVEMTVLGAPEVLLAASNIPDDIRRNMEHRTRALASEGLRILALATRTMPEHTTDVDREDVRELSFWGLIVFSDPIRADVPAAVRDSQQAGTRLVMVTGDHAKTAEYIAKQVGILQGPERVIEGKNLPADLELVLDRYDVFARVSPEDKVRIVNAYHERGQSVAMIGDGVNDAPALLRADIGVAVGSGTDVAKDASDLVLLNDSFSIIVRAIRQGRILFANILKVTLFLLSGVFSEIIMVAGSILSGLPLALLPGHILWVNIIEDGLPAIALAFDKEGSAEATRSPKRRLQVTSPRMWAMVILFTVITDGALFILYTFLLKAGHPVVYARTMAFTGLGITSLLYVFSVRSLDRPVWRTNPFRNWFLNVSVLVGFAMYGLALYVPIFNEYLRTIPLSVRDWMLLLSLGIFNIAIFEVGKRLFISRNHRRQVV